MIDISGFRGEIPKLSDSLLPDGFASTAVNCDLEQGVLKPANGVSPIIDVGAGAASIFKMGAGFLQWPAVVDVVKSLVADSGDRILFTGDGYPKESNASLALTAAPFPTHTRRLGIPAPTNALTITPDGTAGEDIVRSSSYVYTLVGKWEDGSVVESAPSYPTAVFEVHSGITPKLTEFADASAAGAYTTHYRIYRLNSGNAGAEYQYVDEISVQESEYHDVKTDDDLGEVLPTTGWTSPKDGLSGLTATSHGLVFGFKGNTIYPSEVFIPYAFPSSYSLTTESDIVGLGYTGSLVVALTRTVPYLLIGQSPETLSLKRLGYQQPCVSQRSIVNIPGGIVYAATDGLFRIDESGRGSLITKELITKKQWKALAPETLFSFYYNGAYLGFFSGTPDGFSLDLETGEYKNFTFSETVHGGHYASDDDLLYLIRTKGAVREVVSWDTGSGRAYTWQSKEFTIQRREVYTAAMVKGDFSSGGLTLYFYADGKLVHTRAVTNDNIFRIRNMSGEKFQIKAVGTMTVERIMVGRSVSEIVARA